MNQSLRMAKTYIVQARAFRFRPSRRNNEWIAFLQVCTAKHRKEYLSELRENNRPSGQIDMFG